MKKIIISISVGLIFLNLCPSGEINKAISNTKEIINLLKANNVQAPEVDIENLGENFKKVQQSIDENFELLDQLDRERGENQR